MAPAGIRMATSAHRDRGRRQRARGAGLAAREQAWPAAIEPTRSLNPWKLPDDDHPPYDAFTTPVRRPHIAP